jgi:hypothetical protein
VEILAKGLNLTVMNWTNTVNVNQLHGPSFFFFFFVFDLVANVFARIILSIAIDDSEEYQPAMQDLLSYLHRADRYTPLLPLGGSDAKPALSRSSSLQIVPSCSQTLGFAGRIAFGDGTMGAAASSTRIVLLEDFPSYTHQDSREKLHNIIRTHCMTNQPVVPWIFIISDRHVGQSELRFLVPEDVLFSPACTQIRSGAIFFPLLLLLPLNKRIICHIFLSDIRFVIVLSSSTSRPGLIRSRPLSSPRC